MNGPSQGGKGSPSQMRYAGPSHSTNHVATYASYFGLSSRALEGDADAAGLTDDKIDAGGMSVLARLTQSTSIPGLRRSLAAYVAFSNLGKS